jgi:hypothetical protein
MFIDIWLDSLLFLAHLAKGNVSFCHLEMNQSERRIACGGHVC